MTGPEPVSAIMRGKIRDLEAVIVRLRNERDAARIALKAAHKQNVALAKVAIGMQPTKKRKEKAA